MLAPTFGRGFLRRLGHVLHPGRPNPVAPLTSSLLPLTHNIVQHYVDARSPHSPHSKALAVAFAATSLAVVEGSRDRPKTTSCAPPSKNGRKGLPKNAESNATLRNANAKGGKTKKGGSTLNLLDPSDNAFHLVRVLSIFFILILLFVPAIFLTIFSSSLLRQCMVFQFNMLCLQLENQ